MEQPFEGIAFSPSAGALGPLLRAHIAHGRARVRRARLIPVFAVSSLFVWVTAVWPRLLSMSARGVVLRVWLLLFLGVALARLWEWRLERRLRRLVSEMEPPGLC